MARRLQTASFDCLRCGACCVAGEDHGYHAELDQDEAQALLDAVGKRRFSKIVHQFRDGTFATAVVEDRSGNLVCSALRGSPGRSCSCSIHETKPSVCRTFIPGSRRCLDARAWYERESGRRLA